MIMQLLKQLIKFLKQNFINGRKFNDLAQLELELFDYINWYNNLRIRIHGGLNYLSPVVTFLENKCLYKNCPKKGCQSKI